MQEKINKILALSNADFCEVRLENIQETAFNFRGKHLNNLKLNGELGGSIRVLVNGSWGFVSFNKLASLEKKLKQAEEQALLASQVKRNKTFLAPVETITDQVYVSYKEDPRRIPLEEKIELFEHYNNIFLTSYPEIVSTSISYFDKHIEWYYGNTEGTNLYQEKLDLGGHLGVGASNGFETSYNSISFGSSNDYSVARNLEEAIKKTAFETVELVKAPTVKGGQYTVILDPILAGTFIHEAFGHLSEADDFFADKNLRQLMQLGKRYASPLLNVYDSGLETGSRGYMKYDDEGVPTNKTYLIKEGVLSGHLHSRESAAMMEAKPTGNARALDYAFPPICRMRTTCIEQGESSFSEMLSSIDQGLYAVGAYGGETNGELFTFIALKGYMIEGGKLGPMVKNVNLSGNVFSTLEDIDMIGNDFLIYDSGGGCGKGEQSPLATSEGAPHIRIKNVVIGGDK